ncbi:substrate-binding periplasmic protein [Leucobacter japonicus]|uniref:substrate-binding periplasmic protein n=1 Tax=Leucobacter japonicus TaxID=1461259 RepID=UPI0006A78D70|nr:transporter substrate-binding domain-containing protein [Leucobacter japonicus]
MKPFTPLLACGAAAALVIGLAGCSGGASSDVASQDCTPKRDGITTLTAGVLTVGVPDSPPLTMPSGDEGYEGVDADVIRGFAKEECLKVDAQPVASSAGVTSVEQGRTDTVLGGWYRTAAREKVVSMGYPMYLDQVIIAADKKYDNFDDLKGKKIGCVEGYMFTEDLQSLFGDDLSLYSESQLLLQDLEAGRLDAVVEIATGAPRFKDFTVTTVKPDERVQATLEAGQSSLPFNKDFPELREAFDDYVKSLHENGSMEKILDTWGLPTEIANVGEPRIMQ